MPSPSRLRALVLTLVLLRGLPAVATSVDEVCTGDPCVLTKAVDLTAGSNLNFGERAFRIAPNGRLSLSDGDSLTIHARTVTLQPGAIIRSKLFTPIVGVSIRIEATEDILIQRSATPARIEAQGQAGGGSITLDAGGDIDLAGSLRADGTAADASGGVAEIVADGGLTMSGELRINGGLASDGGIVTINTGGAMVVGRIDASGGVSGGSLELTSAGGISTTDFLSIAGTAAGSSGGDATVLATGGSIFIGGRLTAQAEGSLTDGSDGGDIDITADGGNVQVFERIDAFAGGPGALGGGIAITAGADLRQSAPISAHGGTGGDGGSVDLTAGGLLGPDGLIDVHGVGAGTVFGGAGGQVRARGEINADGENGDIHLTTRSSPPTQVRGPVVVSGNLHARALPDETRGLVRIEGCDVTVDATARLVSAGSGATNQLKAGRRITVAGEMIAGPPGSNLLQYLDPPGLQPITVGAHFDPAPTLQATAGLLPCSDTPPPGCPNGITDSGEDCDDGNTTACDGCSATCTSEACGNGMLECEACDDGNVVDGDGCDANCTPTGCGNGRVTAGEACDDGNVADGDGCDANCTPTGCGNGRVTTGEECDDGNTTPGDGCDASCQIEAPSTCGNNVIDEGEDCDGGNTADCDGCSHLCLSEGCGNNRLECGEVCDDGGTNACDGECAADCSRRVSCGDGISECTELCDAGANNGAPGSGCDTSCRVCAIGSGADCPCETDFDCSPSGRCAGLACVDGVCSSVEVRQCSDGNACNGVETCSNGDCGTGTPLQCGDADPCTVDSCSPAVGCLHTLATGIPSIACRVEAFRSALAAAPPDQVQQKLRARLDSGAEKLQAVVEAAATTSDNVKLSRLLKKAAKRAKKLVRLIDKGARKNRLPADLAASLRAAAAGAQAAAQEIRGALLT